MTEKDFARAAIVVKHTTSKKCSELELSDEIDKESGERRPLKVVF